MKTKKKILKIVNTTLDHTLTSNGLIERQNQTLRKIIRDYIVRADTLRWIDKLQNFI
jgi:hypothetical protein